MSNVDYKGDADEPNLYHSEPVDVNRHTTTGVDDRQSVEHGGDFNEPREKYLLARRLQHELANLNRISRDLTSKIEQKKAECEILVKKIETYECKNTQLAEENAECAIHTSSTPVLRKQLHALQSDLDEVNRKLDISNEVRSKMRTECIAMECDCKRLSTALRNTEFQRNAKLEHLEQLLQRRAELELVQEVSSRNQSFVERLHNMTSTIRVYLRIRNKMDHTIPVLMPFRSGCFLILSNEKVELISQNVNVSTNRTIKNGSYNFNRIFPPSAKEAEIFDTIGPILNRLLEGQNMVLLNCNISDDFVDSVDNSNRFDYNLLNFTIVHLFKLIKDSTSRKISMCLSFLEICNERVRCLLSGKSVQIKDTGELVHIWGQREIIVEQMDALSDLLDKAMNSRSCDRRSSKISHFILIVKMFNTENHIHRNVSTFIFVDLALPTHNSARSSTRNTRAEWFIQRSFTKLSNVFYQANHQYHINCRGSRLTEMLKPCFCGDTELIVFLTVSDDAKRLKETKSCLELGKLARDNSKGFS